MVLLKNNNALPLCTKPAKTQIALYGYSSYDFIAGGTGSGNVNHAYVVSLPDGLKNAGYKIDKSLQNAYIKYVAKCQADEEMRLEAAKKKDPKVAMLAAFLPTPRPTEMEIDTQQLAVQAQESDVALITLGRISGEFLDRKQEDFYLTQAESKLISSVCQAYHKEGKKVIVLLNVGGVIETAHGRPVKRAETRWLTSLRARFRLPESSL